MRVVQLLCMPITVAGLHRLKSLITRKPFAPTEIESLIGETVHCVVHIAKKPPRRRVEEIISVKGYENGYYNIENLFRRI